MFGAVIVSLESPCLARANLFHDCTDRIMTFLSRSKTLMQDADTQLAAGPVDRGPRARATGLAWLVERLEERVLLSKGLDDGLGALDHHGGLEREAASLARQQVVQVKVA